MLQTIFTIPISLFSVPLQSWLFGIWTVVSVIALVRLAMLHGLKRAVAECWLTMLITGIAIWILPALMEPTGLPIRGYGVMLLLAVASGVGLSVWRAERIGFDPEIILSLAICLFFVGIVGARLFYIIEYWDDFKNGQPVEILKAVLNVTKGGLVVYGCMLAGGAALVLFIYKHHLPGLVVSDLIAPGVVLGMAIGRVGCFLNGCCFGGPCDLPWAVRFPQHSPPSIDQAAKGELFLHGIRLRRPLDGPAIIDALEQGSPAQRAGLGSREQITAINNQDVATGHQANLRLSEIYGEGVKVAIRIKGDPAIKEWTIQGPPSRSNPIHPAQLYSAIDAALLCLFLLAWDPYRQREGELTALTLTLHPISRFLLEWIRIDEKEVFGTPFSISQNISIGILIGAIVCWYVVLSRPKGLWSRPPEPRGAAARRPGRSTASAVQ